MSVSGSGFETEVVAWSETKGSSAAIAALFCGKKVTNSTVKKEQSSNRYVHSVEAGGNEEDGSVDVIAEGEKNAVLVLVRLAE